MALILRGAIIWASLDPTCGASSRATDLTAEMLADNSGWQEILAMPEQVPDEVLQPK